MYLQRIIFRLYMYPQPKKDKNLRFCYSNEPLHELSNNVVRATSKASDQPAHTRSLIRVFASRLSILLNEHHLAFLSLKGGCRGSSESTRVKMPHCWKSHALAQFYLVVRWCPLFYAHCVAHSERSHLIFCSLFLNISNCLTIPTNMI